MTPINNLHTYLAVDWPVSEKVKAYSTTRQGGISCAPFDSFNLAKHVGDDAKTVERNRQKLIDDLNLPQSPRWLEQIHSTKILEVNEVALASEGDLANPTQADASYTAKSKQVCIVMTADCLPVLFASRQGDWVAAAHAGWRGLADGILQQTIERYPGNAEDLCAWMGPAISQKHFEVGQAVFDRFVEVNPRNRAFFLRSDSGQYYGDLFQIANNTMQEKGVQVYGGEFCSYEDKDRFYSYRREQKTGRMASLIWIENE